MAHENIQEGAWDELVIRHTEQDIKLVETMMPRQDWPRGVTSPNLVALVRFSRGKRCLRGRMAWMQW